MSPTSRDLFAGVVAGIALNVAVVLVLAPWLAMDRIAELFVSIPVLMGVLGWFAFRRWREVGRIDKALRSRTRDLDHAWKQRRAMEKQIREGNGAVAMGSLGEAFAAKVASVLEPARSLAREAEREADPGDERTRQRLIAEAAEGAMAIVERMRLFGTEAGREVEVVVAADALRQAVELARNEADPALDVDYRLHDGASRIRVSVWELEETTRQLVANAVQAMGPGGRLVVSLDRTKLNAYKAKARGLRAGSHVRVRLSDNGPGIAQDVATHVFEPFFTTRGAGHAKGLGLAIAYSLVRRWNAHLCVEPRPDKGATFEILIPVTEVREA